MSSVTNRIIVWIPLEIRKKINTLLELPEPELSAFWTEIQAILDFAATIQVNRRPLPPPTMMIRSLSKSLTKLRAHKDFDSNRLKSGRPVFDNLLQIKADNNYAKTGVINYEEVANTAIENLKKRKSKKGRRHQKIRSVCILLLLHTFSSFNRKQNSQARMKALNLLISVTSEAIVAHDSKSAWSNVTLAQWRSSAWRRGMPPIEEMLYELDLAEPPIEEVFSLMLAKSKNL